MTGRLACLNACVPDTWQMEPDHWHGTWLVFFGVAFFLHLLTAAWLAAYGTTPGEDLLRALANGARRIWRRLPRPRRAPQPEAVA